MADHERAGISEYGYSEPGLAAPHGKEEPQQLDDDGRPKRTGTLWTACAHIITAAIGAGVLSLSWAMSQLGWIAGVSILLLFSAISLYTAYLLADCYRSPNPLTGKRNYSYMEAVKATLGKTMCMICGWILYGNLTTFVIGYTITTAKSLVAIQKSNCHRKRGTNSPCKFSNNPHMIGLGIIEIFLSQIPNFHKLSWLSTVAATMSFAYSLIGIGLSIQKIVKGAEGRTSLSGVAGFEVGVSASDKVWRMFTAAGDIAFACSYAQVFIDIQDTLKSSPPENKVMKKASTVGVSIMTTFFVMCGCFGYAAFGNHAPENLLAGLGYQETSWIVDMANLFIVVHLVGAYQVLIQPVFRVVEFWASRKWPDSGFITCEHPIGRILFGSKRMTLFSINLFRLTWRTLFVVMVTVVALALPFFTDMLALMGAIGYWPIVVYFPVEMHIAQNEIGRRTRKWFGLQFLSLVCFLLSLAAASGAIQGLYKNLHTYKPFMSKD
ncbi:Amino acid transporter, transmembrane domain containing protein [Trema orientale]|uniref:Amino acid transporter, transmembrane domain containing protein n=1 Tax=Trema orientale TaxID=63057 RepID=A0A2P5DDK3_TREOI|nr:Amino acid transporter, transmembrane domain containing protein [Trema orientale]